MAEMDTSSGGGHKKGPGVKKGKKLSTRVDLTPMVDLGFLLITFFMYTTTMNKPNVMVVNMPFKDEKVTDETKIDKRVALTILLSKDHRLYHYEGIGDDPTKPPDVQVTTFKDKAGIRDIILRKKQEVDGLKKQGALTAKDNMTVVIKPDTDSEYDDLVNILDEMTINGIQVYAIVNIGDQDREYIRLTEAANPGK